MGSRLMMKGKFENLLQFESLLYVGPHSNSVQGSLREVCVVCLKIIEDKASNADLKSNARITFQS